MRVLKIFRWLVDSQRDLGLMLRFEVMVPFTIAVFIAGGSFLTLPPGPLCDEGMVLFMEGGCDWGESNIFFYAKVSLLVTVNLAALIAWKRPPASWSGFLPHLALAGLMARVFRDGGGCDTSYANPNGSIGQMILEMACFGVLGIAVVRVLKRASWGRRLLAWVAWNGCHVGLFYLFLWLSPHWTWQHSALLGGSMLGLAAALWAVGSASVSRRPGLSKAVPQLDPDAAAVGFSRRQILSLYLIALPFALLGNPFGVGWMTMLCITIGLLTAWLARLLGPRASRVLAVLLALLIPGSQMFRASVDYREQRQYADRLLAAAPSLTLEDVSRVEVAARTERSRHHPNRKPVNLLEVDDAIRGVAEKVLAPGIELRPGAAIALYVPLEEKGYGRIMRNWFGGPYGDVAELVIHYGYGMTFSEIQGHELILELQAEGGQRGVSWFKYATDRALRFKPPWLYSGWALEDASGHVRALLLVQTLPRGAKQLWW